MCILGQQITKTNKSSTLTEPGVSAELLVVHVVVAAHARHPRVPRHLVGGVRLRVTCRQTTLLLLASFRNQKLLKYKM